MEAIVEKKPFDNVKAGRLLVVSLKFLGLWKFQNYIGNTIYQIYGWTLHFTFTFLFIFGMFVNVGLSKTLEQLSEALYMTLTEIALFVKVLTFLINSDNIRGLFTVYEKELMGLPETKDEEMMLNKLHIEFSRLRNSHSIGSTCVIVLSCIAAYQARSLPFPCWIPFNYDKDPNFFYAYIYVTLGISWTALSNVTIDLAQSYFLFQISNYYRLLGMRFTKFGYDTQNQEEEFKKHIKFHNFIIRLTERCQTLISLPVLVQISLSALVICFTAYKMNTTSFLAEPSKVSMYFVFGLVMCLQIYLPCKYGNDLSVSAGELIFSMYDSNWINLPMMTRKNVYIYMEYLKKPVIVKAGNFFEVGLSVFSQTMNNAYGIYAVLKNVGE